MSMPQYATDAAPGLVGATPTPDGDVFYPCSDGKPMAENMWQWRAMQHAAGDIETARPAALVAADLLVYPERGNPKNAIAPDVLAAFGLGTHRRSSYFVWREGKPPDWVLEVASPGTALADWEAKRIKYAQMGVPEYWLFDPRGRLFRRRGEPQLQGLKLVGGEYAPLPAVQAHGAAAIRSEALGLDLRADGELIRFSDSATGKDVLHRDETEAALAQATARAEREAERAEREAQRAAELAAEIERLRADSGADRR